MAVGHAVVLRFIVVPVVVLVVLFWREAAPNVQHPRRAAEQYEYREEEGPGAEQQAQPIADGNGHHQGGNQFDADPQTDPPWGLAEAAGVQSRGSRRGIEPLPAPGSLQPLLEGGAVVVARIVAHIRSWQRLAGKPALATGGLTGCQEWVPLARGGALDPLLLSRQAA